MARKTSKDNTHQFFIIHTIKFFYCFVWILCPHIFIYAFYIPSLIRIMFNAYSHVTQVFFIMKTYATLCFKFKLICINFLNIIDVGIKTQSRSYFVKLHIRICLNSVVRNDAMKTK